MSAKEALAGALSGAAAGDPGAEQLELLPPTRFEADDTRRTQMVDAVRRDRAGRPPGARNLATRQTLDFVRRTLGDPVIDRARWLLHTPETLARELGCTQLEAFDRLDRIRSELSRLFYAPLAPVDAKGDPVVPIFAMSIGGGQAPGAPNRAPWEYMQEVQQNQPVTIDADPVSHAPVSHGEGK